MKSSRTTLRQIAEHCGLSIRTVSEILSGKDALYRPGTRDQVRSAALALDYRPNGYARAIKAGKFGAVALVSPYGAAYEHIPENALVQMAQTFGEAGVHLVFSLLDAAQLTSAETLPRVLGELMVDGLIINWHDAPPAELLTLIGRLGTPAVWFNHDLAHDAVRPDDFRAAEEATQRLLTLGHRNIAYIDYPYLTLTQRHVSRDLRLQGYERAMRQAGLNPRLISTLVASDPSEEGRRQFTAAWLKAPERPSAILSARPNDAAMVLFVAHGLGLKCPEDLAAVAFAEAPVHAGYLFDTIVPLSGNVGAAAASMLLRKLASPKEIQPTELTPCEYLVGETVGAYDEAFKS